MLKRLEFPQHILLAWWNTGLSSICGQKKNHHAKIEIVKEVIRSLINDGVDFIALAEVDDEDLRQLYHSISNNQFHFIQGTTPAGNTRFDLGVLYNTQKLSVQEHKYETERWAESNIVKLALKLEIMPYLGNTLFTVFISHWPSPLSDTTVNREIYGGFLRGEINKTMASSDGKFAYVITMGDFNYEPFDKPLSDDLWATRDRVIASRKQSFLYNPFWRRIGERADFCKNSPLSDYVCGTYFHQQGKITHWRTVDQMMFSSSFLTSNEWYLDEKYSVIWNNEVFNFTSLRKNGFDHFPILSAVEFVSHD